jgi:hypothetical protein
MMVDPQRQRVATLMSLADNQPSFDTITMSSEDEMSLLSLESSNTATHFPRVHKAEEKMYVNTQCRIP